MRRDRVGQGGRRPRTPGRKKQPSRKYLPCPVVPSRQCGGKAANSGSPFEVGAGRGQDRDAPFEGESREPGQVGPDRPRVRNERGVVGVGEYGEWYKRNEDERAVEHGSGPSKRGRVATVPRPRGRATAASKSVGTIGRDVVPFRVTLDAPSPCRMEPFACGSPSSCSPSSVPRRPTSAPWMPGTIQSKVPFLASLPATPPMPGIMPVQVGDADEISAPDLARGHQDRAEQHGCRQLRPGSAPRGDPPRELQSPTPSPSRRTGQPLVPPSRP